MSDVIHEILKDKIKNSKFTITELAKKIECNRENLSKFINQKTDTLSVKKVDKLCEILNLKLTEKK